MTVVDFDNRGITFVRNGEEVTLTWGEINFLKHYSPNKLAKADKPKAKHRN
jgi:hypothetical protein